MRVMIDLKCPRCGALESSQGLGIDDVVAMAASHVCADGVHTAMGLPTVRFVPGPGERTKLPEERGQ